MKREKLTEYSPDNPLGWSEADFRDVICTMCNIKILTGEPLTPLLNYYYLNNSEEWKRERLGLDKIWKKEILKEQIAKLEIELEECE